MKQPSQNSHQPPPETFTLHQEKPPSSFLKRRNLLLLLSGSFAALGTWQWLRPSAKPATKSLPDLPVNSSLPSAQQIDFLALSTILTSHPHLHPQTSARIYTALSEQDSAFQLSAAALVELVQRHHLKDVDILISMLKNNTELAPLQMVLHQIIDAWYLGVAGHGTHGKVIAYESALMFDQVCDVLGVPGYCPAAPGYWTAKPVALKIARKIG